MSTQETSGGNSSDILLNTNKEKGKPGRKRGPVWAHFNDISTKKEGYVSCKCKYCGWTQNWKEVFTFIEQYAEEQVANFTSKKSHIDSSQT
ncbi:hypothetical protein RCL_jg17408.t1 [Rhizophagus clarus]|uniref:BED-type domain-containing protein n=1 Tax=Rhizophagus clarus TaxID=94130 RepID=A0A8H3LMI8_9GLOM|nr:hypothetical protein RCL_jg17408.t1 [Rhizophagus clarus]